MPATAPPPITQVGINAFGNLKIFPPWQAIDEMQLYFQSWQTDIARFQADTLETFFSHFASVSFPRISDAMASVAFQLQDQNQIYLQSLIEQVFNLRTPLDRGDIFHWPETNQQLFNIATELFRLNQQAPGVGVSDVAFKLEQMVTLMQFLVQEIANQGSSSRDQVEQTTPQSVKGQALTAALQDANLDSLLPTLNEWKQRIESQQPIPDDGVFDQVATFLRQVATSPADPPGAEIPLKKVQKDVRVLAVDQLSPWYEEASPPLLVSILSKAWPLILSATALVATQTGPVRGVFEGFVGDAIELYTDRLVRFRDVQPQQGFDNAKVFIVDAFGAGLGAHLAAMAAEIGGHPMKNIGASQIAGLIATMAGFNTIANNIWGRAIGAAVGIPAQYQINSIMHPNILAESEADRAFGRRFIDEKAYKQLLSFHGNVAADQDVKAKLAFRPPSLSDTVRIVRTSRLGATEITAMLREGGYPDELIDQMVPPILQAAENSERTTLRFEARNGAANGTVSPAELELVFDRLDMRDGAREIVKMTADLQFKRTQMVAHSGVLESNYLADVIDEVDFQAGLLNLGFQQRMVDTRVARAREKRIGKTFRETRAETKALDRKEESLTVAALKEQFKLGLIDASFYKSLLVLAGVDSFIAQGIVALESIRITGREIRTEEASIARLQKQEIDLRREVFLEQFRKDQITDSQLESNLLLLGIAPTIVIDMVTKERLRRIPTQRRFIPPTEDVKARELRDRAEALLLIKFRRGQIDANALQSGLIQLGIDPALVKVDVDIEVAKRFREIEPPEPPTEDTAIAAARRRQITDLQRAFRDRGITLDTLRLEIERLVSDAALIEVLLEEAILERRLKEIKPEGSA